MKTKLEVEDLTTKQAHENWIDALETSALAHKELKDARTCQKAALDAWISCREHVPLDEDAAGDTDAELLKWCHQERALKDAAEQARDAEKKAYEIAVGHGAVRAGAIA